MGSPILLILKSLCFSQSGIVNCEESQACLSPIMYEIKNIHSHMRNELYITIFILVIIIEVTEVLELNQNTKITNNVAN